MTDSSLPVGQILHGDALQVLPTLPEKSIDLIFADPPYNLQLSRDLWRPNLTRVNAVDDEWDQFDNLRAYDEFTRSWLSSCKRVLKDNGTLWVIGTYHNIYRVGGIMQDLGFWFLNDILWIKTNPMPNFRGVRFTNAHEILIWASKFQGAKYTFNHHAMKELNGGKQMRSDWVMKTCVGKERIKVNGEKAHSTQKPEALLYRILLAASQPGDIILDPFFGSGTTGAVARTLHRQFVGIEQEEKYIHIAQERIDAIDPSPLEEVVFDVRDIRRLSPRIPFGNLLENCLIKPGQNLYFHKDESITAKVRADGKLILPDGFTGSIHQTGRYLTNNSPCNGWELWLYEEETGERLPIDHLRQIIRDRMGDEI